MGRAVAAKVRMPTAPKLPKMPGIANPKAPKAISGGLQGYIKSSKLMSQIKPSTKYANPT